MSAASPVPPPRLLICGFGVFPGVPVNPATLVVERLEQQAWSPSDAQAHYRLLPTTWSGAFPTLAEAVRQTGATGVLLLGVANDARSFRVETLGRNQACLDRLDAAGARSPSATIAAGGPLVAPASGFPDQIAEAIVGAGLSAVTSGDAGDYLCNHTFYRALTELDPPVAVAFVHLPPLGPACGLEQMVGAVRAAASAMARAPTFRLRPEPQPTP